MDMSRCAHDEQTSRHASSVVGLKGDRTRTQIAVDVAAAPGSARWSEEDRQIHPLPHFRPHHPPHLLALLSTCTENRGAHSSSLPLRSTVVSLSSGGRRRAGGVRPGDMTWQMIVALKRVFRECQRYRCSSSSTLNSYVCRARRRRRRRR